jgi:hypothetical protein
MSILTISHSIFLNSENRHSLYNGNETQVIGVSVPVWVSKKATPGPAEEVFCRYTLTNTGMSKNVVEDTNGYAINIPPRQSKDWLKRISDDTWRALSEETKAKWYDKHAIASANQLLDLQEGGSGGYLSFIVQANDTLHFVEIKPIEALMQSMI